MSGVEWITTVLSSGVLGVAGSLIQEWMEPIWPWLAHANVLVKRSIAWVLACGLASGAYYLLVWFGVEPVPHTAQAAVQALFPFWFIAVTASQGRHAIS